jgi:hypothetical protein
MAARAGGRRVPDGRRWRVVVASLGLLGVVDAPARRALESSADHAQ